MNISRADAFHLRLPIERSAHPPMLYGAPSDHFDLALVRLETDSGLVGWGEAFGFHGAGAVKEALETLVFPMLLGQSLPQKSALLNNLRARCLPYGRTGPVAYAVAAIDIALWDLLGKEAGLPLHRLLGGSAKTHLGAYASLLRAPDAPTTARAVEQALKRGFKAIKLHGTNLDLVHTARDVAGYEIPMMIDADCGMAPKAALEFCAGLAELEPYWLEEPVYPAENCEGISEIRANGGLPVAAGENAGSLYDFKHYLNAEAIDYATPCVGKLGLTETLAVAALCRAHNVPVAPACPSIGPARLATMHFVAAAGEDSLIEHLFLEPEVTLYGSAVHPFNGSILLPQGPGLGIEPDLALIQRFKRA